MLQLTQAQFLLHYLALNKLNGLDAFTMFDNKANFLHLSKQ